MAHLLKSNSKRTDEIQESKMPTINELIEKMMTVNEWLKTKKAMNTQMGSEIYEICNTLKIQGKQFEEGHKVELNRFFGSIRQIACRTDNHELGLPCRLKILELLELRGMGWRTNLAHAQYYCKRQNELLVENAGTSSPPPPPTSIVPSSSAPLLDLSASVQQQQKPMALTTPQFSNKATDTGYGINRSPSVSAACAAIQLQPPPPLPPHLPSSSSVPFSPFAIPPPPPVPSGFYFVPSRSAGNFIPTVMPHNQQQGIFSPTSVPLPLHHPSQFVPSMGAPFSLFNNKMQPKGVFTPPPNLLDILHDEFAPPIHSKSSKIPTPQNREEFTIRNNDSGKVMGVKGRRVALIEEISKTVISFQKVDPKCKDRQLTIIAEEKGAIEVAKKLIAETIERNVSPERPFDGESSQNNNGNRMSPAAGGGGNDVKMPMASTPSPSQMPIQIEKGPNGSSLVVASEDPAILAALQNALNEYLKALAVTKKAEEGENQHGSNNDNGDDCARNEKMLTYERTELLEIRDKTTANDNLIEEIRQKMDGLDIFVMAKNQEEGTN